MRWLIKTCRSEKERIEYNIQRLDHLRSAVKDLGHFVVASQSGGFQVLKELLQQKIVLGNPKIHDSLKSALIGENNSKIALDSPQRFQEIMKNTLGVIDIVMAKQKKELRNLDSPTKSTNSGT